MSLYDDLGVAADCSLAELRAAYRKKAKKAHPDAGGDADEFAKLSKAVTVLQHPARRERYDRTGEADAEPDNFLGQVSQEVASAFQVALQQLSQDLAHHDVIEFMVGTLKDKLAQVRQVKAQLERERKKMKGALKRVGFKGSGHNLLANVLDKALEACAAKIDGQELGIKILTAAIKQTREFTWETDPVPTQATGSAGYTIHQGGQAGSFFLDLGGE